MMSLTMMSLTPGPLVRALFLFALKVMLFMLTTWLVAFVAYVLAFFFTGIESNCDIDPLVVFVTIGVESKGGRLIELFWRPKS